MSAFTQNWIGPWVVCRLSLAGRQTLGVRLRCWTIRAVALVIALTLGLLSPLSCVVHCAIHATFPESIGATSDHAHHSAAVAAGTHAAHAGRAPHGAADAHAGHAGAAAATEPALAHVQHQPQGTQEPATPPTPRALYELTSQSAALLVVAGLLIVALILPPPSPLRPVAFPPPTPPPRALTA